MKFSNEELRSALLEYRASAARNALSEKTDSIIHTILWDATFDRLKIQ